MKEHCCNNMTFLVLQCELYFILFLDGSLSLRLLSHFVQLPGPNPLCSIALPPLACIHMILFGSAPCFVCIIKPVAVYPVA